ncbi:MAG: hypothetical protein CSA21_04115 [Deltaproteobacteria bacterium]|nr:MAG: hypothetical protein CSA21_04115 [Deltaproteobacteria bacterium]
MHFLYERITYLFDPLQRFYEHERMHRKISVLLIFLFLLSLVMIEVNRRHLLPPALGELLPLNHFSAVQTAFTVILILEVISLIFVLPCSFSRSVGKQFEILALILMRNAFKELSYFSEPIAFAGNEEKILHILANGFGALLIFALLGLYYMVQSRGSADKGRSVDLYAFVAAKKGISLVLLGSFIAMGINAVFLQCMGKPHGDFLHGFYTLLVLSDILLVLVAQCFQPSSITVFRNSGYALSTLIIRIALVAPVYYNVLLGVAAIIFAISLALVHQRLFPDQTSEQ